MGATCSKQSGGHKHDTSVLHKSIERPALSFIVDENTPVYSSEYVGGKAYNLLRLNAEGVFSPPFMIVSAEECSEIFVKHEPNFEQRFNLWIQDPEKYGIEDIRQNILNSTLSEQVIEMLDKYLAANPGKSFAIRSSFNDMDSSNSVFAGLFETYLHVTSREAILQLIIQCSLSCLKDEAAPFYRRGKVRSPRMAVIVMVQLESEVSGILFQANPVTGSRSTCVISASYGQGDGVNGGVVAADEWWINAETLKIRKRVVEKKEQMIGLSGGEDGGIVVSPVPEEKVDVPCLSDEQVQHVVRIGKRIQLIYKSPQDIEFAWVNNRLSVLQTRPISTFSAVHDWTPPQPDQEWWLYTTVNFPMTPLYAEVWSKVWSEGLMYNSHLMGNIFSSAETCILNGFGYYSLQLPVKPTDSVKWNRFRLKFLHHEALLNAEKFWKGKTYMEVLTKWKSTKKKVQERHRALTRHKLSGLGDVALLEHFNECYQNLEFMFHRHIIDTTQSMVPVTWFVIWTTLHGDRISQSEVLGVLGGRSPVTEGLHGEFPHLFKGLAAHTKEVGELLAQHEGDPEGALTALKSKLPRTLSDQFAAMVRDVEYRLLRGYDTVNQTLKERPRIFLAIVRREIEKAQEILAQGKVLGDVTVPSGLKEKIGSLRDRMPAPLRPQFDDMLAEANSLAQLRDERALYTDLTAAGILHHCLLEIGHRVARQSPVFGSKTLMLYATYDQVCALLMDHDMSMERSIVAELKQRRVERRTMSIRDAPVTTGAETEDLPMEAFPTQFMAQSYVSSMLTLRQLTGVEKENHALEARYMSGKPNTLYGIGGSSGKFRGEVVVIGFATDVDRVKPGSVVVTESTSSLINLVLPFAGAIVTDFGALLSHAAICAREANIPCVLGTKTGSTTLRDGQVVDVDGTNGTVTIVSGGSEKVFSMLRQPPVVGLRGGSAQAVAEAVDVPSGKVDSSDENVKGSMDDVGTVVVKDSEDVGTVAVKDSEDVGTVAVKDSEDVGTDVRMEDSEKVGTEVQVKDSNVNEKDGAVVGASMVELDARNDVKEP